MKELYFKLQLIFMYKIIYDYAALIAISLKTTPLYRLFIYIAARVSNFFTAESDSFQRRMNFPAHGVGRRRDADADADANADANAFRRPICRRVYVRAQSQ